MAADILLPVFDFIKNFPDINFNLFKNKLKDGLPELLPERFHPFEYAAREAHHFHLDYLKLAAALQLEYIYSCTESDFKRAMQRVQNQLDPAFYKKAITTNIQCVEENDKMFSYAALKTLEHMFLLKDEKGKLVERPQHLFLRVAVFLHDDDDNIASTYNMLSEQKYIHATPTLMNAGLTNHQLSSCFLLTAPEFPFFYSFLDKCYQILRNSGGIGCSLHRVSAKHLVPCLRLLNDTVALATIGNERRASCAVYLEPWHVGIYDFLEMKQIGGTMENRARDLFYGLWIPDLFMRRVKADELWSLMCPVASPGLEKVWGQQFEDLYVNYEQQGRYVQRVRARDLFKNIVATQIETGGPYMLYKDTCNRLSPYEGKTIEGSNLCTEIIEYANEQETAVCNLASVSLPRFVDRGFFDFEELDRIVRKVTINLNRVIEKSRYPVECAKRTNLKYKPIGIGVQGLADVFQMLGLNFDSVEAKELDKKIFNTIYQAAVEVGVDNIQHTTVMPTATTSLLLGNNESVEPYTSNLYMRRLTSGNFIIVNPHLVKKLKQLGLWNPKVLKQIQRDYGSVKGVDGLPEEMKLLFRTAWEISQKELVDMAVARSPYIDQSQSLNIFMENPTFAKITSMHFYGWENGLKTGMYYLRSQPAAKPVQFTLEPTCMSCT